MQDPGFKPQPPQKNKKYEFSIFKSMAIHACFHMNLYLMFENPYTNGPKTKMIWKKDKERNH